MQRLSLELRMDPQIKAYQRKLKSGKGNQDECAQYCRNIAKCAERVARKVITENELPDGILYWNIAKSVLEPLFLELYDIATDAVKKTLEIQNKRRGIQMKFIFPDFQENRMRSILNLWVNSSLKEGENETV